MYFDDECVNDTSKINTCFWHVETTLITVAGFQWWFEKENLFLFT